MLLRYNPPRAERRAREACTLPAQGDIGSVGKKPKELLAARPAGASQSRREKIAEGEEDGIRSEMKKRKERKRTSEATRRNGYEEIPPPVIPP